MTKRHTINSQTDKGIWNPCLAFAKIGIWRKKVRVYRGLCMDRTVSCRQSKTRQSLVIRSSYLRCCLQKLYWKRFATMTINAIAEIQFRKIYTHTNDDTNFNSSIERRYFDAYVGILTTFFAVYSVWPFLIRTNFMVQSDEIITKLLETLIS